MTDKIDIKQEMEVCLKKIIILKEYVGAKLDLETDEKKIYSLTDYKLELLDIELRLKDMIENLKLIN